MKKAVNIDAMKEAWDGYQEEWKPFLDEMSSFKRHEETSVDHLVEALTKDGYKRGEIVGELREFEDWGFGELTKGARGKPTRIHWLYSPALIVEEIEGYSEALRDEIHLLVTDVESRPIFAGDALVEIKSIASDRLGLPKNSFRLIISV